MFECMECGRLYKEPVDECDYCGGSDIDLADEDISVEEAFEEMRTVGDYDREDFGSDQARFPSDSEPYYPEY